MDERGHWHKDEPCNMDELIEPGSTARKFVISIEIGEKIMILKSNGEQQLATFDDVTKNRVTLTPVEGHPAPYFELAEVVSIVKVDGSNVKASVWDNRDGKIVLRTHAL